MGCPTSSAKLSIQNWISLSALCDSDTCSLKHTTLFCTAYKCLENSLATGPNAKPIEIIVPVTLAIARADTHLC